MTDRADWFDAAAQEAWEEAQRVAADQLQTEKLQSYQNDPVGFVYDVLGERLTDDCKRLMESVRDYPITLAKSGNATGKSFTTARIATWFYKVYPDSKVFLTAAPPEENVKKILWGEIMGVAGRHKDLFAGDTIYSRDIKRNSESFITRITIPQSGNSEIKIAKFSGRHSPHMLFAVDEGDGVPDEAYDGIEGCMSGGMARLLVMFNPKMQAGALYHMEHEGRANVVHLSAFSHPNVITGKDIIPGAVSREITVRRINEWTIPLHPEETPSTLCFIVPDFLVGAVAQSTKGTFYPPLQAGYRKITTPQFSYMVMGEYPAQSEAQLINKAWIDAARQRYDLYVAKYGERPPEGIRPILGLDVAEMGGDYNVICLRYGGYVPRIAHLWSGLDVDFSARRGLDIYRQTNAYIAMIDGTSWGAGIAPFMAREGRKDADPVRAIGVKVASAPSPLIKSSLGEFYMLRDQLYWALMLWLRDDNTAMLPPDQYLIDELSAIQYEVNLRGKIRITDKERLRSLIKRSPDRADALALTFAPYERAKIIRLADY
jgi:hypothetical protein